MTQGERVKELRKHLGLTLEKFGERLGVQKSAISKIERGDCGLTEVNIKAICREFSINEEWLRAGSGEMKIPVEDEAAAAVSDLVEKSNPLYDVIKGIMIAYQKLDSPSREVIDQFILDAISQKIRPQKTPDPAAPEGNNDSMGVSGAEGVYIKKTSYSVRNTGLSALNTTEGTEKIPKEASNQ